MNLPVYLVTFKSVLLALAMIVAGVVVHRPDARLTVRHIERPDIETSSERYRKRFKGKTGRVFLSNQAGYLLSLLKIWPGARILDIGGGHGQYTRELLDNGYEVTVLGSTHDADAQIRPLVESGRCRYVVGNILDLPFEDRSFDVVISFRLLPHVDAWHELIHESARVARRGVIVDFPVLKSFNALYPAMFWLKKAGEGGSTRPFTVFREQEVNDVFAGSSFKPTGRIAQYFLPMVVHRVVKAPGIMNRIESVFSAVGLTSRFGSPVILRAERTDEADSVPAANDIPA